MSKICLNVLSYPFYLFSPFQFVIYNTILRKWPEAAFQALNGNNYTTTIHCLVSGVTKVSRRTKIPPGLILYRGFGGLKLPDKFYNAPEGGYKGFVEWGFMVIRNYHRRIFLFSMTYFFHRALHQTRR
jgi:hypothetical protein